MSEVAEKEFMAAKQSSVTFVNDASTSKQDPKAIETSSGRIQNIIVRIRMLDILLL